MARTRRSRQRITELEAMDPLQRVIMQSSRTIEEQDAMQELFMGRLTEEQRKKLEKEAAVLFVSILRNMHLVGAKKTLSVYCSFRKPVRLIEPEDITTGFEEVKYLADSLFHSQYIEENIYEAIDTLTPIFPYLEYLTWNNLVGLGRLTREYNLEWALASYDWQGELESGEEKEHAVTEEHADTDTRGGKESKAESSGYARRGEFKVEKAEKKEKGGGESEEPHQGYTESPALEPSPLLSITA